MATVKIIVSNPRDGEIVGENILVRGSVSLDGEPGDQLRRISRVTVQFGAGGLVKSATISGLSWECTGNAPSNAIGGNTFPISVSASAEYIPKGRPPSELEDANGTKTATVSLEQTPPALTIDDDYPREVTAQSFPYLFKLSGTAYDTISGIKSVQYRVGSGTFAAVDNISGSWSRWSKTIDLLAGEQDITIQAIDQRQVSAFQTIRVSIRVPFEPTEIEQVFAPTTYLRELLNFAQRWIKIGSTPEPLSADMLTHRFFQPFNRLTMPAFYEQAVQPLPQARIAIEVLRQQINLAVPAEQKLRHLAYESILRELGSSYDELRLARLADDPSRAGLARRIGLEIENTRPDRLDQITLSPDAITDAQLESLFGYRAATSTDPLQHSEAAITVLNWRLAAIRHRWQREDESLRDKAAGALPIIDPDVIQVENLTGQEAANPAFALWAARRNWVAEKLAVIAQLTSPSDDELENFDRRIRSFIGELDIPALDIHDRAGSDISLQLTSFNLELDAFRFLVRCRNSIVAGNLFQIAWPDIFDILLQVQKQRQYRQWRAEERQVGLVLEPLQFQATASASVASTPLENSRWRGSWQIYAKWLKTLTARAAQAQTVSDGYRSSLNAVEAQILPKLRDALIEAIGQQQPTSEDLNTTAERLTRTLLIDLRADSQQTITRVGQAIETVQGIIFSVRSGRIAPGTIENPWRIEVEANFDREWQWMEQYRSWRAAIGVFAYPENQLSPSLYVAEEPFLKPSQAFLKFIIDLRSQGRMTPELARKAASGYLEKLRAELGETLPDRLRQASGFLITEQLSDSQLMARQGIILALLGQISDPNRIPQPLREIFWLVPMAIAQKLQDFRYYLAALDWYQTVYAFNLPIANRKIYRGLELEGNLTSKFSRVPEWLIEELNPHVVARQRQNAYSRFTVMSIVRCFLAYADSEFSRNSQPATARARTLYETAIDLLSLPDIKPESGATIPFPPNSVWESLKWQAESNLAKIHNGMNIAGIRDVALPVGNAATFVLPSQYRYAVLAERAKNLVNIAQQVEAAFLSALERRDAEAYSFLQAGHDLQVAQSSLTLQDLKLADAGINVQIARRQQEKSLVQFDFFTQRLREGLSASERSMLDNLSNAKRAQQASIFFSALGSFIQPGPAAIQSTLGGLAAQAGNLFSLNAQIDQTRASFERRQQDWQLQKNLADQDIQIAAQQIALSQNQQQIAQQEQALAALQFEYHEAVLNFLANKFTNAELFEWMTGVLGRVYAYFLQQATALAQLAQAQLAFERQELALGFVQSDYWQDSSDAAADDASPAADRRGLTGSGRLLQDIYRLDQYAFDTDRRKLHLTQTLALSQIAAVELQRLRETGLLILAIPPDLFDREFPGHYLRLIKRVRISLIALIPPVRGLRATLSASGTSRVVVGGDRFTSVVLQRSPEAISFTAALNATGLFELESENGLLLPFEGMGLDTVWQLELPKPANPFDYRTIADVLITFDYTALDSWDYRQQVIQRLGTDLSVESAFSCRDQFADQWYDLSHSDQTATPMVVRFKTERSDFPPNLQDLKIQQVVLFFVFKADVNPEIPVTYLRFTEQDGTETVGGGATAIDGIISSRRGNAANWIGMIGKSPVGEWELALLDALEDGRPAKALFEDESIEDILFVITYAGRTPAWPT